LTRSLPDYYPELGKMGRVDWRKIERRGEVYLWTGENESAINQLESLKEVPRALTLSDLAKSPDWDSLRADPRFQNLL
jgi:hypothetical protein